MKPRLVVGVPQVRQGPPDNPSLGTIALYWQPPECELRVCESKAILCFVSKEIYIDILTVLVIGFLLCEAACGLVSMCVAENVIIAK